MKITDKHSTRLMCNSISDLFLSIEIASRRMQKQNVSVIMNT